MICQPKETLRKKFSWCALFCWHKLNICYNWINIHI